MPDWPSTGQSRPALLVNSLVLHLVTAATLAEANVRQRLAEHQNAVFMPTGLTMAQAQAPAEQNWQWDLKLSLLMQLEQWIVRSAVLPTAG